MANKIKHDSIFIVTKSLTDSNAFKAGDIVGNFKDDSGRWIARDSNGKKWKILVSYLRNENYYEFIGQYSIDDIIYYLCERNEDYQSVMYEIFVDAVMTTFKEATVNSLDDIYRYILENLV